MAPTSRHSPGRLFGRVHRWLDARWYPIPGARRPLSAAMMRPLGALYAGVMRVRRALYARGVLASARLPVPVIVVGNVTVGGTGKSPLAAALVRRLEAAGYRPGLVCRGYRGRSRSWPCLVEPDTDPGLVGDEAVMLRQLCGCPVAAGPDRVAAGRLLLAGNACDVIVSDDGLQHLALGRDVEIAVVDADRGQGNGRCLPAGPLREPADRLQSVHIVVEHHETARPPGRGDARAAHHRMWLTPGAVVPLDAPEPPRRLGDFVGRPVHGVCGIGHPERFFRMLERHGLEVARHAFEDHHDYAPSDLAFSDGDSPVICTEKDAVKLRLLLRARGAAARRRARWWSVGVGACLDDGFDAALWRELERARAGAPRGEPGSARPASWQRANRSEERRRHWPVCAEHPGEPVGAEPP